jgi:hypothetical protein
MIIVDDATDNFYVNTLRTVSSEYKRILQITPIFTNVHKLPRMIIGYHVTNM